MKALHKSHIRLVLLLTLVSVLAILVSACSPGLIPQSGTGAREFAVEITNNAVTAGSSTVPGITTVSVNNTSQSPRTLMLARLNTNVTLQQFMETLASDSNAAVGLVKLTAGRDAPAGETRRMVADLKEGTYVVIAFPENDTAPLTTSFQVTGSASGQAAPKASATVNMVDFSFVVPEGISSGQQNWEVKNTGQQWHEMVILKPQPGFTQEKLLELFHANQPPQGQPPFEEIGTFGPISDGERGWLELDLQPGTYMVVCFLPDLTSATGEAHLEKGMIRTFEVK